MPDFTRFLRGALSLTRDAPTLLSDGTGVKPRLLIISRHRTPLLLNFDAVVHAAEEVGFEAVVSESDVANDIGQVVPWGGLQWIARMDYGEPAEAMGLKYIQYEIAVGESSLKDKYPRDHEIFTNPTALHKKGFGFMRQTLMDGQDITIDLARFRERIFPNGPLNQILKVWKVSQTLSTSTTRRSENFPRTISLRRAISAIHRKYQRQLQRSRGYQRPHSKHDTQEHSR